MGRFLNTEIKIVSNILIELTFIEIITIFYFYQNLLYVFISFRLFMNSMIHSSSITFSYH